MTLSAEVREAIENAIYDEGLSCGCDMNGGVAPRILDTALTAASALGFVMVRREAIREAVMKEREACATIAEEADENGDAYYADGPEIAAAIRNRPETQG